MDNVPLYVQDWRCVGRSEDKEGTAGDEVAGGGVVVSLCKGFACVRKDGFVKLASFCGACNQLHSPRCLCAEV